METTGVKTDLDAAPGFRIWRGQPYSSMPPHWHDQVEINYAVGGSLTYLLAGSAAQVPSGRLSMFWAGVPHGVIEKSGIERFYWIYVPLVWVLRLGLPGTFMRRLMSGALIVDEDPLEYDQAMLDRWSEELPHAEDSVRRLVIREVEDRILRFALAQPHDARLAPAPVEDGPVKKVVEMARFMAENYAKPIQLKEVAAHVGLHPNYAMTLFRRYYGMTLNTYLARLRICQAQYLLISGDRDISRIAFDTGFGSISRFYETFKEISGCTPRQYRLKSGLIEFGPESPFNPCASGWGGSVRQTETCP